MISRNIVELPDSYKKSEGSVNNRLLLLGEMAIADARDDLRDIDESTDIEKAYGRTLDLFGGIVGQKRGRMNDVKYRYLIFTKIASNMSQSTHESVMYNVLKMFNANQGDISLEDISIEEDDKPCVVRLAKMPLDTLIAAGFTSRQAVRMIETVLPACVTIEAENFEGTFEFADTADEHDEEAGFADEERTIGGYFGLLYGEDDETELPL